MAKAGKDSELIVKSKVKEKLAKAKCHTASDVPAALGNLVAWYLDQAAKRAKANGRKTVRGSDILIL